ATTVTVLVDGVVPSFSATGNLQILAAGGSPTSFMSQSHPSSLAPRPMLRLQGRVAGAEVDGFDPAWQIGAIEFRLEYPSEAVSAPDVFPATEASRALAFVSTDDSPGSVRVVLTDPRGFTLPSSPGYSDGDRVGEGPL